MSKEQEGKPLKVSLNAERPNFGENQILSLDGLEAPLKVLMCNRDSETGKVVKNEITLLTVKVLFDSYEYILYSTKVNQVTDYVGRMSLADYSLKPYKGNWWHNSNWLEIIVEEPTPQNS